MLHFKASKFAVLATVCLLGIGATRSAHAQAYTVTNLGGLPGTLATPAPSTTPARWWEIVDSAAVSTPP